MKMDTATKTGSGCQYGYAWVEYLTVRERVAELLKQGFPMSSIHRQLVSEGKITMGYVSFRNYVTGKIPIFWQRRGGL
ncbi:TraK family protein [uncultured Desulfovibrio sp.]|uniref:TraK family protein n=1 Tax=uncultured Desulfovibrio sp. TaxID=167968 RepID=UPI00261D968A|nr:TraK family protein [uncultured Desulfovibrio sp.]